MSGSLASTSILQVSESDGASSFECDTSRVSRSSAGKPARRGKRKRKLEDVYQKITPLQHVLARPDTYCGSITMDEAILWVAEPISPPPDDPSLPQHTFVYRQVSYVPALLKIFDEIIVNAADNHQRDPNTTRLEIQISTETGIISLQNNGEAIPVAMHQDENMWIPTLVFGHLLTSSNFDDTDAKVTGGRNGYGAKLANIFSRKFTIEGKFLHPMALD